MGDQPDWAPPGVDTKLANTPGSRTTGRGHAARRAGTRQLPGAPATPPRRCTTAAPPRCGSVHARLMGQSCRSRLPVRSSRSRCFGLRGVAVGGCPYVCNGGKHQHRIITKMADAKIAVEAQESARPARTVVMINHQESVAPLDSATGLPRLLADPADRTATRLLPVKSIVFSRSNAVVSLKPPLANGRAVRRLPPTLGPSFLAACLAPVLSSPRGGSMGIELSHRLHLPTPRAEQVPRGSASAGGWQALGRPHTAPRTVAADTLSAQQRRHVPCWPTAYLARAAGCRRSSISVLDTSNSQDAVHSRPGTADCSDDVRDLGAGFVQFHYASTFGGG